MSILFAVIAIICAVGWLIQWIATAAAIMYMLGKSLPEPTKEEWEMCIREVIRNLLADWFS